MQVIYYDWILCSSNRPNEIRNISYFSKPIGYYNVHSRFLNNCCNFNFLLGSQFEPTAFLMGRLQIIVNEGQCFF